MHVFTIICGFLSTACAIYVGIPYMLTIVRGQTKPHQFTWLIFSIMDAIIVISQYLEGGRLSVLVYLVFFIYSSVIFGLSLKFGVRDSSNYDRLLLCLSLLTIVAWVLTESNLLAIWLSILIDSFATTMLILKIRRYPQSEPLYLWCIGTMAMFFSCLTLVNHSALVLYIRPVYGLLSDLAIVFAIYIFHASNTKHRIDARPTLPQI